ncbi:LysR family transcriptional regulator [Phenylobacterium aquaticum]|uniref:LysR family transcriptional regulator n=1 Tax=Phenylobacterium aquaticum TaxID=1763816 RepID=UPI0026F31824|nr:LysR family transcriptional regulator [Phenylobacterium aquaticum]
MLDWDDLRVFLACARTGSFKEAARRLGLDPTTVARRVQRLEDELRTTLVVRSTRGMQLTAAGAALSEASQSVETAVEAVGRVEGGESGVVRLSASEGFGAHVLAPAAPALMNRHPGLQLELVANAGFLSASSREVDIAVTLAPPTSSRLSVERLTDYGLGLYASPAYLDAAGCPAGLDDLPAHQFVGYIDDLIYAGELRYLSDVHPALQVRTTSSSIRAQLELTRAGAGLCVLPHFMARNSEDLCGVLPDVVSLTRTFWISVHRELQATRRIRLVRDWLIRTVTQQATLLQPAPQGPPPDMR